MTRNRRCTVANRPSHFPFLQQRLRGSATRRERRRRLKVPKTQSYMPRPLFEVPGWSVSTNPASSSSSKKSKKRKRLHSDNASSEKLGSVQVNLEKLMESLERVDPVNQPPKKKYKGKKSAGSPEGVADNKTTAATPPKVSPEKANPKGAKKPSKESKGTHTGPKEKGGSKPQHPPKAAGSEDSNLTTLQNRMKKKLDGARFR